MIDEDEYYPYDEIILLPFYTPYVNPHPFEVFIKKSIKAITYYDYEVIKEIISEKESETMSTGVLATIMMMMKMRVILY